MTDQEILEAEKLIAGMRDDLSLIGGTTDEEKLVALVEDKVIPMKSSLNQLVEELRGVRTNIAAVWADLAASLENEIRNPLIAIKTFAQLLPERFEDADFRRDFHQIVLREIDHLDKIITQINNFAYPPELVLKPLDLKPQADKDQGPESEGK